MNMNTSIIIGLLIALVIICATVVINSIICKGYKDLKIRWNSRVQVLSELTYNIGKLDEFTDKFAKCDLSDEDKLKLHLLKSKINDTINNVKYYERESF